MEPERIEQRLEESFSSWDWAIVVEVWPARSSDLAVGPGDVYLASSLEQKFFLLYQIPHLSQVWAKFGFHTHSC